MIGFAVINVFVLNGVIRIIPLESLTPTFMFNTPIAYMALAYATYDTHGMRAHYLPALFGNMILLFLRVIEYLFEVDSVFLFLIPYLLNLLTLYFALRFSEL